MHKQFRLLFFLLFLSSTILFAKNGYNYYYYGSENKLNKTAIVKIATQQIKRLAIKEKIPQSWKAISYSNIKKVTSSSASDWMVNFHNTLIKNKKKQVLYVFIGVNGDIKGMNYSGH